MSRYTEIKSFVTQLNEQLKSEGIDDLTRRNAIDEALKEYFNIGLPEYTQFYQIEQESKSGALEDPFEFLVNSVKQMMQGVTLGHGDEIEAYLRVQLAEYQDFFGDKDKAYEQILREVQAGIEGFEEANPSFSFASEILGGFFIPFLGTGTNIIRSGVARGLKYAPKLLGKAPKALPKTTETLTQGTVGGTLSAGYEKGKTGEVTPEGTTLGVGFGAGGYHTGQLIRKGVDKIPKDLRIPLLGPVLHKAKKYLGSGEDPPVDPPIDAPGGAGDWIDPRRVPTVQGDPLKVAEERKAMRMLIERLVEQKLTFPQLLNKIDEYVKAGKGEHTTFYDLVSEMEPKMGEALQEFGPVQKLMTGAKLTSGEAQGMATSVMKERGIGAKERAIVDLKNLFSSVLPKFPKYSGVKAFKKEIMESAKEEAQPHYNLSDPIELKGNQRLVNSVRNFINKGEDTVNALKQARLNWSRDRNNKVEMPEDPYNWTVEMFDTFKKQVDDVVTQYLEGGSKRAGSSLNQELDFLTAQVDDFLKPMFANVKNKKGEFLYKEKSPYETARDIYSGEYQAIKAYELGAGQMSNPNREPLGLYEFKFDFDQLPNDRARKYAILGLYEALSDAVTRLTPKYSNVRSVTQGGPPKSVTQEKIRYALTRLKDLTKAQRKNIRGKLSRFEKAQNIENNFLSNLGTLIRGSKSPEALTAVADFQTKGGAFASAGADLVAQSAGLPVPVSATPYEAGKRGFNWTRADREQAQLERLANSLSEQLLKRGGDKKASVLKEQVRKLEDYDRLLKMYSPQRFRSGVQNPLIYSLLDRK